MLADPQNVSPGSVFFPGKDISHPTLASWDNLAVVSVMDCRSAEPQIDADALIDARAPPPRLAGTRQFY